MANELTKGLQYLTVLGPGKVIVLLSTMPGDKLNYLSRHIEHKKILKVLSQTSVRQVSAIVRQSNVEALVTLMNSLEADASGMLVAYHLRMPDQKREAVKRFKELNFTIVAAGDSYNDTAMLGEAHGGILFHPPENVIREFPQFPVTMNYDELRAEIDKAFAKVA